MKWLVLMSLVLAWCWRERGEVRRTDAGRVRGERDARGHNRYLGIPYARVSKENRFQDSLPVEKWDGIYDAVNEHVKCSQRFGRTVAGQEDCLTLNIYTPNTSVGPLPVMVFIHGGGFREGNNSPFLYGPDYFMDKGVVLVTINYRLEILGYLCLGIKEAPGNVGLKDQVAALQWIRKNIKEFGGDPDSVTIFGESAGAASVAYHIISPMSNGLFHKAVMQSGTAITPWSFQYDPLITSIEFTKQMGYNTDDPYQIYEIFMNKTAEELLTTRVPREEGNIVLSETLFVPCVEKPIPGVKAFLTDYPHNLLAQGKFNKVPILLGYNNAEGYLFAGKENSTTIPKIDIFKSLPRDLKFNSNEEKREVAKRVKEFYLGDEVVSTRTMVKLSRYHGEPFFKYPMIVTTDLLLQHNTYPLYNYRFARDGWLNVAKWFFGYGGQKGATHADDLFYMFKPLFPTPWVLESTVVETMTTMWSNFAKYGDPTPAVTPLCPTKWLPTDRTNPQILVIDKTLSTAPLWDDEATIMWHDIYRKYRRKK